MCDIFLTKLVLMSVVCFCFSWEKLGAAVTSLGEQCSVIEKKKHFWNLDLKRKWWCSAFILLAPKNKSTRANFPVEVVEIRELLCTKSILLVAIGLFHAFDEEDLQDGVSQWRCYSNVSRLPEPSRHRR